jgi:hypothetical protein
MTDTTTTAPAPTHLAAVTSDGYEFVAECGCGWASEWHATAEAADAAGVEHRDEAVGPPEPFDVAMSELLDIQDDLAVVVMWFAENWSADLPVPGIYCRPGAAPAYPGGVQLMVVCPDVGVLERVAGLLGGPVGEDAYLGRYTGVPHRRAVRSFGRVILDAYAPADAAEPAR